MSSKCWEFLLKNFSTVYSKLHFSCTDEHFEQKLVFEIFLSFLSLLGFNQKKFGLLTENFRHGCPHCFLRMYTIVWFEEKENSRRIDVFYVFSGLRAENILNLSEIFSALLSKLHLAYPEDHSDTFSEFFLDFDPFRDVSSKCWEFHLKTFGTVFSKLHSSCTDEYFEQKLLFEFFFSFQSLLEFNQKKFGLLMESFRHGFPHWFLRM